MWALPFCFFFKYAFCGSVLVDSMVIRKTRRKPSNVLMDGNGLEIGKLIQTGLWMTRVRCIYTKQKKKGKQRELMGRSRGDSISSIQFY